MKRFVLITAVLAAMPLASQADDLSYNYLQAGYDYAHSNAGRNSHGWSGTASAALGEHFQVFGGGSSADRNGDATHASASVEGWNLGGGVHAPISAQTDFIGDVAYHRAHTDGVSGDANSWTGEVGVRSGLTPHVEGWAMAGYAHTRNEEGDVDRDARNSAFGKLGGQYKFNKNWGLVAEGRVASGNRSVFVGPRISF
jgi:Ax21 family sulfation-dependent quorum factor